MTQAVFLPDEAATLQVAGAFAAVLKQGGLVFLQGDLGAGKTTFSRGLLRAMGWAGPVKSPTYTLIEPYELGELSVFHCDLYRLADPEELEFIGGRELLGKHVLSLIEWPEKARGFLPAADLVLELRVTGTGRTLAWHATSDRGAAWLPVLNSLPEIIETSVNG